MSREDDNLSDRAFQFEVFVRGNQWLIHTAPYEFLTNKVGAPIEFYEAGTNGTNIYSAALLNAAFDPRPSQEHMMALLQADEKRFAASGGDGRALFEARRVMASLSNALAASENDQPKPKARNQAVGEINPGTVPVFSELNLIAPVWLAFCSRGVIGSNGTNSVPGLFHQRNGNESPNFELFETAQVRRSTGFPYLPEAIQFSNQTTWLAKRPGRRPPDEPASGSDPPSLEATYEATFAQYGELSLPATFQIRRYSPSASRDAKPHLRYLISGRVTNLTAKVELADFLPHLPVVAAISDKRFVDGVIQSGIRVFTKPGEWPSVATVRATKAYARIKAEGDRESGKSNYRRTTVLLFIASISIALAVLAWKTRTTAGHNTKPKDSSI